MLKPLPLILSILSLAGLAALVSWNLSLKNEQGKLAAEIGRLKTIVAEQAQTDQQIKDKLAQENKVLKTQERSEERDVDLLSQKLQRDRDQLSKLREALESLKNSKPADSTTLLQRIQADKDRLKELNSQLQSYKGAESELNQEKSAAVKKQKNESKFQIDSVNAEIKAQDQAIKSTQDQLNFWRKRNKDPNQSHKVEEYQTILTAQLTTLQKLKGQKIALQQNESVENANIPARFADEKEDIKDSQAQIQDQVARINVDLKDQQAQASLARSQMETWKTQWEKSKKEYDTTLETYKSHQAELQQKQKTLQQLKSNNTK
jgi:chromosome segregation ATPase